ncbi:MAG: septal ring lytic transglycosylase RlpA family protein [Actinomycetota bacterium]|nr:septal ring lytic transglycosylase RlpA family protein [Actinomycetota bacterium]
MSSGNRFIGKTLASAATMGVLALGMAAVVATGMQPMMSAWATSPAVPAGQLGVGANVTEPVLDDADIASKVSTVSVDATASAMLVSATPLKAAPVPKPVVTRAAATTSVSRSGSTGWSSAKVSWYGPGFYGNTMAGGGVLTVDSMVVAHRSLPFGTRVQFEYNGRSVTAVVQDRGPFVGGRTFDLGPGVARALGFNGVHTVSYRILG